MSTTLFKLTMSAANKPKPVLNSARLCPQGNDLQAMTSVTEKCLHYLSQCSHMFKTLTKFLMSLSLFFTVDLPIKQDEDSLLRCLCSGYAVADCRG